MSSALMVVYVTVSQIIAAPGLMRFSILDLLADL